MKRETLIRIINGLARDGKVFSNEQDFQFELALALKNEAEVEEVKLEAVSFPRELGNLRNLVKRSRIQDVCGSLKEYTDLIVRTKDGSYYAIELKFKAANSPYLYNSRAFGDVAVMKQGAANNNVYHVMEDIVRLESINSRLFSRDIKIAKGFAIVLTNTNTYRNSNFENSIWNEFAINEGRVLENSTLSLHSDDEKYRQYEDLEIKGRYIFNWEDYDLEPVTMLNDKTPKFSFLVVEVDPLKY